MIGLDTNVLVRYLTSDDPVQSRIAANFLKENCTAARPGFINVVVLSELVWVLQRCYRVKRPGIVQLLNQLLQTRELHIQSAQTVWFAVQDFDGEQPTSRIILSRATIQNRDAPRL